VPGETLDPGHSFQRVTAPANFEAPGAASLQRVKSEEERGAKHRRKAKAPEAIRSLKTKLKPKLSDHLFDGMPITGSLDKEDPSGLHAYTGGSLPGITEVDTVGSTGRIHGLEWKFDGATATKRSSMFPSWMGKNEASALVVLNYAEDKKVVSEKVDTTKLPITKSEIETYICRGLDITIGKSGDTVYPVHGGLGDWLGG
jgi:hypothetical protein